MTSLAVPEFGELCPICVEFYINKYNEDPDLHVLSDEDIENVWRNLGRIIEDSGYVCPATRHISSLEYNKHLELHSFGSGFRFSTNFSYDDFSHDGVYLKCAKCQYCPHSNEVDLINKVKDHFKIHQFFEEKLRDLPNCINRCIDFDPNESSFKFSPYVGCCACEWREEVIGDICQTRFAPKDLLIHLISKHFVSDAINQSCPACRKLNSDSENEIWSVNHRCFEIIDQLHVQYVVKPRRAIYAFLTYHKRARQSQEVDPSNYLGMIDDDIAHLIASHMQ